MEIHIHASALSDEQRDEVEQWAAANHAEDIRSIAVHDRLVSVLGLGDHLTSAAGTAIRSGGLAAELTSALANMRNISGTAAPLPEQQS